MSNERKSYRFGEILEEVSIPIEMDDNKIYNLASIKRRNGGFFEREKKKGKEILTKTLSKLIPGSFVISKMQVVHGACAMAPNEINDQYISASYASFLPRDPLIIDIKYLEAYSHTRQSYDSFFRSSHGVHIEKMTFKVDHWLREEIELPPLSEQKKIVEIFSKIDDHIKSKLKIIDKLCYLKKARINEFMFFNKHKSLPLGQIAKCQGGFAFKSLDAQTKGLKWLKIANVSLGKINWEEKSFLPDNFKEKFSDFLLQKGDIVLAMTRPVIRNQLKVAMISKSDDESLLNQRVARLVPKAKVFSEYLFIALQFPGFARQIEEAIAGSDPPNISSSQIESLILPLPDFKEQQQIASIIRSIQILIDHESQSLKKIQLLKKSIFQDLLSGKKRVKF